MKDTLLHFIQKLPKTKKLSKIIYFGLPLYWRNEIRPKLTKDYNDKHEAVLNYLNMRYKKIIEKYKNDLSLTVPTETLAPDCPYWVFWYQGESQMPDIIKACVASIRRHAGKHPVHLLHKDNYTDYVRFSDTILRKVKEKQITLTHFSDLVRNRLLAQHGGLWLDATLYLTDDFYPKGIALPFFSLRTHLPKPQSFYICNSQWSPFLLGGG